MHLSCLSVFSLFQPLVAGPSLPASPFLSSFASRLLFLRFRFCLLGFSLYFENPVPFFFNIDTQTVEPTRKFYFCNHWEGEEADEEEEYGEEEVEGRVDDRSAGGSWECFLGVQ